MSPVVGLMLAVGLLLANAYFVGAEFAVMAARRSQIEPLAQQGSRRARDTLAAMESVSSMLACAQLGVTVCSIGLGAVAEPALAQLLEPFFHAAGVPADLFHPISLVISLVIVIYFHVVVGEMVPKNLAISRPDRAALFLAPPLLRLSGIISPVIRFFNGTANAILRLCRVEPKDEVNSTFTAEEVTSIVAASRREGLLGTEHGLVSGALEFSGRTAGEVAVPLAELVTVGGQNTPADVEKLVARTGFSRFAVTQTADNGDQFICGYLHLKDVLHAEGDEYTEPVPAGRVRLLATVSATDEVEQVLAAMQRSGAHLAAVIDSGVMSGVVFLEDVLEELVGEVRDETRRK